MQSRNGAATTVALRAVVGVLVVASLAAGLSEAGGGPRRQRVATVRTPRSSAPVTAAPVRVEAVDETTVASVTPSSEIASAERQEAKRAFESGVPSAPVTLAAPPTAAAEHASSSVWSVDPYRGLGTWADVYDWSQTYTRDGAPRVDAGTVDAMADAGVQTLYIQASKWDSPTHVLEPERLIPIINRAHERDMAVVAWYLPTLEDTTFDLQRITEIGALEIDGLSIDIESRAVKDVAERNRRLVALSAALRAAYPDRILAAAVLPPVVTDEINKKYWPDFPWRQIEPSYDVWQPMGYWTNRKASSGWRNAKAYTAENVIRLRRNLGNPNATVHPIGGIGDRSTTADYAGFLQAARDTICTGGSVYDWRTTNAAHWQSLQGFRS